MKLKVNYCNSVKLWWIIDNPYSTMVGQIIVQVHEYVTESTPVLAPARCSTPSASEQRQGADSLVMKFEGYIVPNNVAMGNAVDENDEIE